MSLILCVLVNVFMLASGKIPTVSFWSELKDVKIFINNEEIGMLPQKDIKLFPGSYKIRAEKRNFHTKEFRLEVTWEEFQSYEIKLDTIQSKGFIQFYINPFPQKIYINDEKYEFEKSNNVLALEKGFYRIRFEHFGYKPIIKNFRIFDQQTYSFSKDFEKPKDKN
ncbi:MAG: hypothetical protein ACTTHG_06115 [Treponemataceae bacterium]